MAGEAANACGKCGIEPQVRHIEADRQRTACSVLRCGARIVDVKRVLSLEISTTWLCLLHLSPTLSLTPRPHSKVRSQALHSCGLVCGRTCHAHGASQPRQTIHTSIRTGSPATLTWPHYRVASLGWTLRQTGVVLLGRGSDCQTRSEATTHTLRIPSSMGPPSVTISHHLILRNPTNARSSPSPTLLLRLHH